MDRKQKISKYNIFAGIYLSAAALVLFSMMYRYYTFFFRFENKQFISLMVFFFSIAAAALPVDPLILFGFVTAAGIAMAFYNIEFTAFLLPLVFAVLLMNIAKRPPKKGPAFPLIVFAGIGSFIVSIVYICDLIITHGASKNTLQTLTRLASVVAAVVLFFLLYLRYVFCRKIVPLNKKEQRISMPPLLTAYAFMAVNAVLIIPYSFIVFPYLTTQITFIAEASCLIVFYLLGDDMLVYPAEKLIGLINR